MRHSNRKKITEFLKNEYARMVFYVRSIIAEAADRDSEDIVQDVMIRIFEKADISHPIEDIAAYVYRSLKNSVIDILRKRNYMQSTSIYESMGSVSLFDILHDARFEPEKIFEKKEITKRLYEAIDMLPDELKSILVLNEIEGKTFREISEETGIPSGTLIARKARALERVRNTLLDYKNYMEK